MKSEVICKSSQMATIIYKYYTFAQNLPITCSICLQGIKGKGSQKYKWILSKSIWKTAYFDANCIQIGFLLVKISHFYVFIMAASGGRHFEIGIKFENFKTHFFFHQKLAYI